ncbi:MAG: helix-turn-helix transcriptional regulator [Candidatus Nanopelagicales bacterium]
MKGELQVIVLRNVIGDELRRRRQDQGRTLRDISGAASVSLGYLSEIERGQKEASSELISAICGALDVSLSDILASVSSQVAQAESAEPIEFPTAVRAL